MPFLPSRGLLELWEHGAHCHVLDQGLLLFAAAHPELAPESLADLPISVRDAALFRLLREARGRFLPMLVDCPACGGRLEFSFDTDLVVFDATTDHVQVGELSVRRPSSRDLAATLAQPDADAARRQLAQRILVADCEAATEPLGPDALDTLELALERADGGAQVALDFVCEACDHGFSEAFDVVRSLWAEVDVRARRLLRDVHTLASAYGWSEPEVLALGELRRQAYLALVSS